MKINVLSNTSASRRRRLLGPSVLAFALMQLGALVGCQMRKPRTARARSGPVLRTLKADTFGPLKHVNAGFAECGLRRSQPRRWAVVILLQAGPTTFTAIAKWRPCWRSRVTVWMIPYLQGLR